jgi:hypothetical protein
MMANESPGCNLRADAHRSGGRDNGGKRPSLSLDILDLRRPFAIVTSRGETLPAVGRAIIECPDDWKAQERLVLARICVNEDELLES